MSGHLHSVFVATLVMLACSLSGRAASQVAKPDFAFPKDVSASSLKSLDSAIAKGDSKGVVRSLLDYSLAQITISESSIPACISRIDSVASLMPATAEARPMLEILQAVLYNNVYQRRMWVYNRRTATADTLPADCSEWTGGQFRQTIRGHLYNALADSAALREIPLARWEGVVTQNHYTRIYYPTLYNFAVYQTLEILNGWGGAPQVYPAEIQALHRSVLAISTPTSAPAVNARLSMLDYRLDYSDGETSRRDSLLALYNSYLNVDGHPSTEYAGDILLQLPAWGNNLKREYSTIRSFLKACPNYWRKASLEQNLAQMEQKQATTRCPSVVAPGAETTIEVETRNVTSLSLEIYNVSSSPVIDDNFTYAPGINGAVRVATIPVKVNGQSVPFTTTVTASYTFKTPGNYIVVPVVQGARRGRESFSKIHVTQTAMFATTFQSRDIYAVDPLDGSPLQGVTISVNPAPYRKGSVTKKIGTTGADGFVQIGDAGGTAVAANGDDRFARPLSIYNSLYTPSDKWTFDAKGFTSLPLYHHGDTVRWTVVCHEYKGGLDRPYAGKEISAVLWNTSSVSIDTLKCATDRFGRAEGEFILPADGLSGRFRIAVDNVWSAVAFEVSDYKLPTFRVLPLEIEREVPARGCVTIRGKAMTYSGMPVDKGNVKIVLSASSGARYHWFPGPTAEIYSTTTTTDNAGAFIVEIGKNILESSPYPNSYFTVSAEVTSLSGETQASTGSFAQGERYFIRANVTDAVDVSQGKLPVEASVVNYEDSIVNRHVTVTMTTGDSTVRSTDVLRHGSLDIKGLAQGRYVLAFACEDADTVRREVIVYDTAATSSPIPETLLWTPDAKIRTDAADRSTWRYAVNHRSHLLATLWTPDTIVMRRWVDAAEGFNRLDISLPEGIDRATLSVIATGGYRQTSTEVEVTRAGSEKGLRIVAETFRDRIVPGGEETWTLRVTDLQGQGREAAIIADMYNTALDALARSDWSLRFRQGEQRRMSSRLSNLNSRATSMVSLPIASALRKGASIPNLVYPEFDTYGLSFSNYMYGGVRMFNAMRKSASVTANGKAEDLMVVESVAYDSAAPADMGSMKMATAGNAMSDTLESAEDEESDEVAVDDSNPDTAREEPFDYRESNVPLAFFRPMLVTDPDGSLALRFTVPNANTTWGFRAVAFTDSLLATTFSRDVIAAKPIMVQPNLPRFLRNGDKVEIRSSVMNALDSTVIVRTVTELFNPADRRVLSTSESVDTVAPQSTVAVAMTVDVPQGIDMLGFRIRSSASEGADGEQACIPVLPSVAPVIETYPFYFAPDAEKKEVKLPKCPADGHVTLQVCMNPSWYVVTALPGLLSGEASTAPEAARGIFSAAIAAGFVKDNPEIASAIREWTTAGKDSGMLTSMLERNSDLKLMLLGSTPWLNDARDDSERMSRLALLFDEKLVGGIIEKNISLLARLSATGGGWKWCESNDSPSRWATTEVLEAMGRLSQLGFLPADKRLRDMLNSALAWDTEMALRDFRKYPDGDYSRYVSVHDLFASSKTGAPAEAIVRAETQRMLRAWKQASLPVKAMCARVLYAHGYKSVAATILESMRQMSESSAEKGMWFPSFDDAPWHGSMSKNAIEAYILGTFAMIEPGCKDIDLMRQWLILQKGAQNWGSSAAATDVIATILSTSSRWIAPADRPVIKIGSRQMDATPVDRITGEYEFTLSPKDVSGKRLTLSGAGDTPAWGAVYCAYSSPIDSVEAASCPELSIAKTILSKSDSITVGDRVTVCLTLHVNADMDYVIITDERAAGIEPVDQMPGYVYSEGLGFYRESRDTSTRMFIDRLPRGTYRLTYDVWANNSGTFFSGAASVQSQYAPQYSAHSSGTQIKIF